MGELTFYYSAVSQWLWKWHSHGVCRIVRNVNDVRTPRGLTAPSIKSVFRVAIACVHAYRAASFRTSTDLLGKTTDTLAGLLGTSIDVAGGGGGGAAAVGIVAVHFGGVKANSMTVSEPRLMLAMLCSNAE